MDPLEIMQIAALLQAAYIRKGIEREVKARTTQGSIIVKTDGGWIEIEPQFALYTAKQFWSEIDEARSLP